MKKTIRPLVTVLTPSWNRSAYLEKVWEGLNAQSYSKIEWIVANDGSTDDTSKVCLALQLKSKFPVTIIEASHRVGKSRMDNELIKNIKGEFVVWCDSDDYLVPDAIDRLVSIWQKIPTEEQSDYIGLTALCSSQEGILQSTVPKRLGIFDTTLNELGAKHQAKGDMLIFLKTEKIKNGRFLEIDFLIPEGSLWSDYGEMKIKFIPEVLRIMDRKTDNRISFSGKMEYCRGKAYSIAICEKNKHKVFDVNLMWKIITYHRYCIHGDINIVNARKLWSPDINLFGWLILYPLGALLALKDIMQRKVVKTHKEYNKNIKIATVRIIRPPTDQVN